jgi:hypothetical protein
VHEVRGYDWSHSNPVLPLSAGCSSGVATFPRQASGF